MRPVRLGKKKAREPVLVHLQPPGLLVSQGTAGVVM